MKKNFVLVALLCLVMFTSAVVATTSTLSVAYVVADTEIHPGGETTVTFTVTNPSTTTEMRSIEVFLVGGDGLEVSPKNVDIGGLAVLQSKDVTVIVKADGDADTTIANLNANFKYYPGTSSQKTLSVNVPIKIKNLPTLQILGAEYNKEVGPGSSVLMNLSIKNNGDGTARDVQIELGDSDAFVAETSDAYIGSIPKFTKGVAQFEITIDPETEIGVYSVPVTITYMDENKGSTYIIEKDFGLKVLGSQYFIVSVDGQSGLVPGSRGTVTVKISNSGTTSAEYLSAGFGNNLEYLGGIDSDDYESLEFVLDVPSDTEWGMQEIDFVMKYRDPFNTEFNETYPVKLMITDPFSNVIFGIIGFVVSLIPLAIGLLVVYFIYKKFFKKKEHHHVDHKKK
jgi:hypothetical protein